MIQEISSWQNICWHFKSLLWPWPWTQHLNFSKKSLTYDDVPSNQTWLQTDQKFRTYSKNSHILVIRISLPCDLHLQDRKTFSFLFFFFWIIHQLMIMHHNTNFGYKRLTDSWKIVRTNIHWHFKPSLWPCTQQSSISQDTPAYDNHIMHHQTKLGCNQM